MIEYRELQKKAFHLTDTELLYDKFSYDRLIEILKCYTGGVGEKVKIVRFSRGDNNYGNFRFITIQAKLNDHTMYLTAYGHGINDCSGNMTASNWNFFIDEQSYGDNFYHHLPPAHTIRQLMEEHKNYWDEKPTNKKFALLEELSDSDSAYSDCFQE